MLTKEEAVGSTDKDDVRTEVEQTTLRFIDLARQMEAFFLQKRFLLSALKPEMVIKEDVTELRLELARKEELLKRHYDKIAIWQNLLADLQGKFIQIGILHDHQTLFFHTILSYRICKKSRTEHNASANAGNNE